MSNELQREIGTWAEITFPRQTSASIVAHLWREYDELADTVHDRNVRDLIEGADLADAVHLRQARDVDEEAADCLILLMALAHLCGFDLLDAAEAKMQVNRERRWGKPDAEDVSEHER